jgi:hypothetical protein
MLHRVTLYCTIYLRLVYFLHNIQLRHVCQAHRSHLQVDLYLKTYIFIYSNADCIIQTILYISVRNLQLITIMSCIIIAIETNFHLLHTNFMLFTYNFIILLLCNPELIMFNIKLVLTISIINLS